MNPLWWIAVGVGIAFGLVVIVRAFVRGRVAKALDRATTLPDAVKDQVKKTLKL